MIFFFTSLPDSTLIQFLPKSIFLSTVNVSSSLPPSDWCLMLSAFLWLPCWTLHWRSPDKRTALSFGRLGFLWWQIVKNLLQCRRPGFNPWRKEWLATHSSSLAWSIPCLPVPHFLEFAQVHIHWISDTIQLSHPLSLSSPALSLS